VTGLAIIKAILRHARSAGAATIDREVRRLDARLLSWGIEKVLSTGTQRLGVATEKFTIDVAP